MRVTDAPGALGRDRAGRDRPLRHAIHLAIGAEHRRHQQRAAGEVLGIAQGGDGDVEPAAAAREGRQLRGDDHRRQVLGLQLGFLVAGVDAEPLQHADQRLAGEHGGIELVAGAVQPDHQAVADELVLADALDIGDVLDPHGFGEGGDERGGGEDEQGGDDAFHGRFPARKGLRGILCR